MVKKRDCDATERKQPLQAVLLADSFAQTFRPVTFERPKVLLPLVNSPMINYALEWLCSGGVEEVFVFCSSHARQIQEFIEESEWSRMPNFSVHTIVQAPCLSVGEALRLVDQKDVIKGDFVLMSGDTVANFDLAAALEAHKKRREKDKLAIMTMVTKPGSNAFYRDRRLGEVGVVFTLDAATGKVLHFKEASRAGGGLGGGGGAIKVDTGLFQELDTLTVRTDLLDCQVDICAPEVLMLFTDNFDYQHLRRDFVTGVLSEEELGNKIFVHELKGGEYAARISSLRAFDAVSRDILHRWTFPIVPDTNVLAHRDHSAPPCYSYSRQNVYKEVGVQLARSARVGPATSVGGGTVIGENTVIRNSVVGRGCHIGSNVYIDGCYIQDNVTIGGGVVCEHALLCDHSVIHAQARVNAGAIVSHKVVVGAQHVVPAHSRVSLFRQRRRRGSGDSSDSDDLEVASAPPPGGRGGGVGTSDDEDWDSSDEDVREQPSHQVVAAAEALAVGHVPQMNEQWDMSAVGRGGAGFFWVTRDEPRSEGLLSLAPPPMNDDADDGFSDDEGGGSKRRTEGAGGEGGGGGEGETGEESEDSGTEDDGEAVFRREVSETFLRCVCEKFDQTNAVIELNALKIAEDRTFADCARYVMLTLMSLGLPAPRDTNPDYRKLFASGVPAGDAAGKSALLKGFMARLVEWSGLLQRFLKVQDDQIELLLTIEEWCSEEGAAGARDVTGLYADIFPQVLKLLYDKDILSEEAVLQWAEERKDADAADRVFLDKAAPFIQWLQEAEAESDEGSDEDEDEDEDED